MRTTTVHDLGLRTLEHELDVPLDHDDPGGPTITVFAREVREPGDPAAGERPFLLYLQGGPGNEAPRPTRHPGAPGWLDRALREFRVLLLDQRGTGRSSPVGPLTLPSGPAAQAGHLTHFRADAIVRDAEAFRAALGSGPWTVLGQSFGGMCVFTYLSLAPHGLREALVTAGVPGVGAGVDEVYRQTYALQARLTAEHHARYPGDRDRLRALHDRVRADGPLELAGGNRLSRSGIRALGRGLGMSDGSARLHQLLELDPDSPAFRHDAADPHGLGRNPLYLLLHEACWADGGPTRWAADRLEPADDDPGRLLGEHLTRELADDVAALAPLREAADLLARHEWGPLYDESVLAANEVPVAAAVWTTDPYVPRASSLRTLDRFPRMRAWESSEHLHNGLRVDGARILDRLLDMVRGRV